VNATDVIDALASRWPDEEYLKIAEAPAPDGRNIDLLVLSLWKSRGYEIDAVEIKVSVNDARREIFGVNTKRGRQGGPAKAEWWFCHAHRFWMAVPAEIADKVIEFIPEQWGLLVITEDGKVRAKRKAPKHDPEPMSWGSVVNVMRCASAAGFGALQRQFQQGLEVGQERARREHERETGDAALRSDLQDLRSKVSAFKETSGIDIADEFGAEGAALLGKLVALAQRQIIGHQHQLQSIVRLADQLDKHAKDLRAWQAGIKGLLDPS
jgi:hypothetical protein